MNWHNADVAPAATRGLERAAESASVACKMRADWIPTSRSVASPPELGTMPAHPRSGDGATAARNTHTNNPRYKPPTSNSTCAACLAAGPSPSSSQPMMQRSSASNSLPPTSGWSNARRILAIHAAVGAGAKAPASAKTADQGLAPTWPTPPSGGGGREAVSSGSSQAPKVMYSSRSAGGGSSRRPQAGPSPQVSKHVTCGSMTAATRNSAAPTARKGKPGAPTSRPMRNPGLV
mmetsp:Transcript_5360/g.13128  ORF Transcript_5360/g.13128 Transcript_5360/m.13128 type:complete len:234 (-) Transcript_5360:75-776(-)